MGRHAGRGMQVTRGLSYQLAAACLLLVLACLAAVPFMQAEQRRRRFQERVEQYAAPYARATATNAREKSNAGAADSGRRILQKWLKQAGGIRSRASGFLSARLVDRAARGAAVRASGDCAGANPAGALGAVGAAGDLGSDDPPVLPLVRTAAPADTLRAVPRCSVDAGACRPGRHSDHRGHAQRGEPTVPIRPDGSFARSPISSPSA